MTVQDGQLRRARFSDVWLDGVRLTATELIESSWIDATIIGSVAAGVLAHGSLLRQVTFRGCKLHGVNFRAATLTDVSFQDCTLREVDFGGPPCGAASSPAHSSRRRTSARSPWTKWTCAARNWASS